MAFPRLIRQSEGLQRIPNPQDFALEDAVNDIFDRSIHFRDFVEEGYYADEYDDEYDERDDGSRVLDYARKIIEHPETDTGAIKSRQEILQSFMAHPNLVKLVLNKIISRTPKYSDSWEWRFDDGVERGTAYLDFVTQLSAELPESSNQELETFRNYIGNLVTEGERLEALRESFGDIQKPGKLELKTEFLGKPNYFDKKKTDWDMERATINGIFDSGKEQSTSDRQDRWNNSGLNIPYTTLFSNAVQQVKSKGRRDLVSSETPAKLEVSVDGEKGAVTGKATYHKLDLVGTLISFRKKTKPVVTQLEFGGGEITTNTFSRAMKYLKSEQYSEFLAGYNHDIKEFADAVVELRYLGIAADHFNQLQEQGVQTTMPAIVEADNRRMSARNLIEPNLVRKANLGDIVANDVDAENSANLYVITGPNNNGKTTYMNALGIAQAMGQAGLMVLAQDATISPRDNVFTHYIRPGDLVAGESRYAHELSRIKEIMKRATGNSLILMDEPCSGTSPEDAKQEADAVVRTIGDLGATAYVATHFHNLIDNTATELPYGRNLHCVTNVDGDDLVYTYKIREGSSNQSNGMYLARKMGVDRTGLTSILTERAEKEGLKLRQ